MRVNINICIYYKNFANHLEINFNEEGENASLPINHVLVVNDGDNKGEKCTNDE